LIQKGVWNDQVAMRELQRQDLKRTRWQVFKDDLKFVGLAVLAAGALTCGIRNCSAVSEPAQRPAGVVSQPETQKVLGFRKAQQEGLVQPAEKH